MRSALQIILCKSIVSKVAPKYAIRTTEMIPNNAPILSAIEARDMLTAIRLLSQRAVSPFVLTVSGANHLEKLAEGVFDILFDLPLTGRTEEELGTGRGEGKCQVLPPESPEEVDLYGLEEIQIREGQFGEIRNLFLQLISQGVDQAHRSEKGYSAIIWLLSIIRFGADLFYVDNISFLLSTSLHAAKTNPFHIVRARTVGDIYLQYIHTNIQVEYMGLITAFLQDEE
ncbi:hypothetical protein GP486_003101 [Trichoglossum hirsutum]|uniref:Uncharacterized protein n=1 Tax=Trichoglossum hirsutum TaxID=265104 RepID=A0A9P8LDU1_9PEZI|nr:hypothetical protein GP486_003101 [Trichoglossum hirsutum]